MLQNKNSSFGKEYSFETPFQISDEIRDISEGL